MRDPTIENNRASQDALKQETSARPTFGECGKETLQAYSPITSLMLVEFSECSKGLMVGFLTATLGHLYSQSNRRAGQETREGTP